MKNCTKCGSELRENDAYCPSCGFSTDGLEIKQGETKNWYALISFIFSFVSHIPGLALILTVFKRSVVDNKSVLQLQEALQGQKGLLILICAALIILNVPGILFGIIGLKKDSQSDVGGRVFAIIGLCVSLLLMVNAVAVCVTMLS